MTLTTYDDAVTTCPLLIPGAFRRRLLHQDRSTGPWLESLPERARRVCRLWRLEVDGAPGFGGTSMVLPVRTAGGAPASLKLVSPIVEANLEATALTALKGHGVVELLHADRAEQALLLERLEPPSLLEHPRFAEPVEAARVAGEVARRIATVRAPWDAPRLAETSRSWGEAFQVQHARATASGLRIPPGAGEHAADIIDDLAEDPSATLTHGDLSLENVMRRRGGAWVAIDPGYLCGPVEFEAHTVVRSVLGAVLGAPQPRAELRRVVEGFCEAAGADVELAEAISFARLVASYFWEAQHSGRADDLAHLLRAIELTVDVTA